MKTILRMLTVAGGMVCGGWQLAAEEPEKPAGMTMPSLLAKARQLTQEELELSKTAVRQAGGREVREFAEKAVELGGEQDARFTELAAAEGVTEPQKISASMQQRLTAIEKVKGEAFDPDYLKMLIDLQTHNLRILEELAKRADAPKLREFALDAAKAKRAQRAAAQKLAAPEVPHVKPGAK